MKTNRLTNSCLFLLLLTTQLVSAQAVKWGNTFGTSKNHSQVLQYFHDVDYYDAHTLYAAGRFSDTMTVGSDSLFESNTNLWFSKIDGSGKVRWTKSIGEHLSGSSRPHIEVTMLKADSLNHCVYAGGFLGSGTWRFGSDTLHISGGYSDFFIAKIDTAGNAVWARASQKIGTPPLNQILISDIALAPDSGIVITGHYSGRRIWQGDTLGMVNFWNRRNGFVSKLNSKGQKLWTQPFIGTRSGFGNYDTYGGGVAVNPNGSVIFTGYYTGTLQIGSHTLTNPNGRDYNFVGMLDPMGNVISIKNIAPAGYGASWLHSRLEKAGKHLYAVFNTSGFYTLPDINTPVNSSSGATPLIIKMKKNTELVKSYVLNPAEIGYYPEVFVPNDESEIFIGANYDVAHNYKGISFGSGLNLSRIDSSGSFICNTVLGDNQTYHKLSGNNQGELSIGFTINSAFEFGPASHDPKGGEVSMVMTVDDAFCGKQTLNLSDLSFCPGDSAMQHLNTAHVAYSWSNGAHGDTTYFDRPGPAYVSMKDNAGNWLVSDVFDVSEIESMLSKKIRGDSILCFSGDSAMIQAPGSWQNVIWNNGLDTGSSLRVQQAGYYFFEAQDPAQPGCTFKSDSFYIHSSANDSLFISQLPAMLCTGDSVKLEVFYSGNLDTNAVELLVNGTKVPWDSSAYLTTHTAGQYSFQLMAYNADSCLRRSNSRLVSVEARPNPVISRLTDTLFSNYSSGNQWFLDGQPLVGDTVIMTRNGRYSLWVTDSTGCSDSTELWIQDFSSKPSAFHSEAMKVYPNPATASLVVDIKDGLEPGAQLKIYDLHGALLGTYPIRSVKEKIDVSPLPAGFYLIQYRTARVKFHKM